MLNNKTIAVVIPAYNEEKQIKMVLDSIPDYVDRVIIVNDFSQDKTSEVILEYIENNKKSTVEIQDIYDKIKPNRYNMADIYLQEQLKKEACLFVASRVVNKTPETDRIILINHFQNGGVGAAVASGYKWCKNYGIACVVKIDGDGQMDPSEIETICKSVVFDDIDYVKGNRLKHKSAYYIIPRTRFIGNSILSILTKVASGYWRVSDTQTAFTAISNKALNAIPIHKLYPKYGYPNDILVKLNIANCTLKEVEIKPIYNIGEKSKMKIHKIIPKVSWLLCKSFINRLYHKYFFKDFHPLFLLYHLAFILGIIAIPYFIKIIISFLTGTTLNYEPILAFIFLSVAGFQSLFFAMWMDIQDNERLYK